MKIALHLCWFILAFFPSCRQGSSQQASENVAITAADKPIKLINPEGMLLETRFSPPPGFERFAADTNSFAVFLRKLPLKPYGTEVRLHDGRVKRNNNIYDAVVDFDIGKKDLHQCADAVMRLRAEYLWNQRRYEDIHFNFTNGFRVDYSEWMKGKRIVVNGNSVSWKQSTAPSNTYQDFWKYMEIIFSYAGTLSLTKELKPVHLEDLRPGDVFIQGGSPGHAVIVVDVAEKETTGEKVFLLAQSYMPAQEIQVLKNVTNARISPWYSVDFGERLFTPEWTFEKGDLKRFEE